jgi:phosphoglycerol transferase
MWSPPQYFQNDPRILRSVCSYDGYLVGPDVTLKAVCESVGRFSSAKPIADFRVYPSSPSEIAQAKEFSSLLYLGTNWDGSRHAGLLSKLAAERLIALYGPPTAWRHLPEAYCGPLPFDGASVIRACAEHGMVLCLHLEDHRELDAPSMRIFEAASAGCVILADDIPFVRRMFGDAVFVIPSELDDDDKLAFIRDRLDFVKNHQMVAREMGGTVKEIFDRELSLDVVIPKIVQFGCQVRRIAGSNAVKGKLVGEDAATIDVFIQVENCEPALLDRAIRSVCDQTYPHLRIILVGRPSRVSQFVERYRHVDPPIEMAPEPIGESGSAPFNVRAGAVKAPYFSWLDPTCTWDPIHLESLHAALKSNVAWKLAYSGCIQVRYDGSYFEEPNFKTDHAVTTRETRRLMSLEPFDVLRSASNNEMIPLSGWLARSELLAAADQTAAAASRGFRLAANRLPLGAAVCSGKPTVSHHVRASHNMEAVSEPRRLPNRIERAAIFCKRLLYCVRRGNVSK